MSLDIPLKNRLWAAWYALLGRPVLLGLPIAGRVEIHTTKPIRVFIGSCCFTVAPPEVES